MASPGTRSRAADCRRASPARCGSPSRTTPTRSASTSSATGASTAPTTAARPGARWPPTTRAFATVRAATTAASTSTRRIPTSSTPSTPSSYKSTDGGNTFTGFKGAPGRRRSAADVDRSDQRQPDPLRLRSGRDRLARRRRHLELVVQPVHRADLSPLRRQLLSLLGLRHAAGRRRHSHALARQPRRDHAARLESRVRVGVGHDHRRSARREHRLRQRQRHPQDLLSERDVDQRQSRRRTRRSSCARPSRSRSPSRRGTGTCCSPVFNRSGRPSTAARTGPRSAPTSASPRRPDAVDRTWHRRASRRRDRIDLGVDGRGGIDLGRHQQRPDQGHARRRQDVERRQSARHSSPARPRRSARRRGVALRPRDRLCGR